jgi:hypothetical protein
MTNLKRLCVNFALVLLLIINVIPGYSQSQNFLVTSGPMPPDGSIETTAAGCFRSVLFNRCRLVQRIRVVKLAEYAPGSGNPIVPNGGGLYAVYIILKDNGSAIYAPPDQCPSDNLYLFSCAKLYTGLLGTGTSVTNCQVTSANPLYSQSQYLGNVINSQNACVYVYIPSGYLSAYIELNLFATRPNDCDPQFGCGKFTTIFLTFNGISGYGGEEYSGEYPCN